MGSWLDAEEVGSGKKKQTGQISIRMLYLLTVCDGRHYVASGDSQPNPIRISAVWRQSDWHDTRKLVSPLTFIWGRGELRIVLREAVYERFRLSETDMPRLMFSCRCMEWSLSFTVQQGAMMGFFYLLIAVQDYSVNKAYKIGVWPFNRVNLHIYFHGPASLWCCSSTESCDHMTSDCQ